MTRLLVFALGLIAFAACRSTRSLSPYPLLVLNKYYADYYTDFLEPNTALKGAAYYWTMEKTPEGKLIYKQYYPEKRQMTHYITYHNEMKNGTYAEWYDNGKKWKEGQFENNKKTGLWKNYRFSDGALNTYGKYEAGKRTGEWITLDTLANKASLYTYKDGLREGIFKRWNPDGTLMLSGRYAKDELVTIDEGEETACAPMTMPYMASCVELTNKEERQACSNRRLLEAVYKTIKYPKTARENGLEGSVYAQFVIEKDGSLSELKFLRALSADIEEECRQVIESLPAWKPGTKNEEAVRVQYTLPIKFKLE